MPITVACPTCNARLKVADNAAGKTVKCPKCGASMLIPEASPGNPPSSQTVQQEVSYQEIQPEVVAPSPSASIGVGEKECPFCGEPVKVTAKRCKHCGEIIDVALRAAEEARRAAEEARRGTASSAAGPMVFMNAGGGGGAAAAGGASSSSSSSSSAAASSSVFGNKVIDTVVGCFALIVMGIIMLSCAGCLIGSSDKKKEKKDTFSSLNKPAAVIAHAQTTNSIGYPNQYDR